MREKSPQEKKKGENGGRKGVAKGQKREKKRIEKKIEKEVKKEDQSDVTIQRAGGRGQSPLSSFELTLGLSIFSGSCLQLFPQGHFPGDGRIENACGGRPAIT